MINNKRHSLGFSLIEVMVTLVILMTGLLGLAGLQGKALTSQMESYQRSQALILLKDMEDRMNANRAFHAGYVTSTPPLGVGSTTCDTSSRAGMDLCEWSNALKGSAEGTSSGAMIGARGCIYRIPPASVTSPPEYVIAVAWQGLSKSAAPAVACGTGSYGNDEGFRRVVTLPITIGNLVN